MDKAHVYVVYIREAHPAVGPAAVSGSSRKGIADPKTIEERERVARDFAAELRMKIPILVDTIDDKVQGA